MSIKKLLEDINTLSEQDVNEINLQDEIEPAEPAQVVEPQTEPTFNDTMSLADQFDAKARIARALEALQAAVEEFKNATAEKIDLLQDQALLNGIDGLDQQVKDLETALASGSKILGDSELNDAFKPELPAEPKEAEQTEHEENPESEEETEEDEDEDFYDFDDEAGLDLLAPEEE
mgnify:CR=1 FL=1